MAANPQVSTILLRCPAAFRLVFSRKCSIPTASPGFSQVRIADRMSQLKLGEPNSGGWDMITANETGPMPAATCLSLLKLWKLEYSA